MTGIMKIKKLAAILSVITVLTIIFSAAGSVQAAGLSDRGNLTIITEYDKNALSGIDIEIFLIATATYNGKLEYTATAQFAEALEGENYDPNGMMASENTAITEKLKAYISEESLSGSEAKTDTAGTAMFDNLEAGVYLVIQKASSDENNENNLGYVMQSFIIPVPYPEESGLLNYIISAHPKIEPKKGTLKLTKIVTGNPGTSNSGFWFTVKFSYPEGAVRDGVMLDGTKIEEELSLHLNAGETAEFTNIPLGTQYEITEVNIPQGFSLVGITEGGKGIIEATASIASIKEVIATNSYTPPPTTTQPTTTQPTSQQPTTQLTTTQPTIQPTTRSTTTQPTTQQQQPTTRPTNTATQPTIQQPTTNGTQPTTESATQPTINGSMDDDEEFEEVDNTVPLGNISIPEDDTTEPSIEDVSFPTVPAGNIILREYEEYEDVDNKIPLGNIGIPDDNPKENPKTGDSIILILLGSMVLCGVAVVVLKKKRNAQ